MCAEIYALNKKRNKQRFSTENYQFLKNTLYYIVVVSLYIFNSVLRPFQDYFSSY